MPAADNAHHPRSILIDGKNIALRHGTGVASYARSLCINLKQMGRKVDLLYGEPIEPGEGAEVSFFDEPSRKKRDRLTSRLSNQVRRILQSPVPTLLDFAASPLAEKYVGRLPPADRYWNAKGIFDRPPLFRLQGQMEVVVNVMNVDAAHWTYPVPLRLKDAANIYTLHDLVPLKLPDTTLDNKKKYFELLKSIVESSDLIITVSEKSKNDIHNIFNVDDRKVINTYQDVSIPLDLLSESDQDLSDALAGIYGLDVDNYILFCGAIEPKKNVGRLIEAYLSSGIDIPLVIAGKDGWLVEDEMYLLNEHLQRMRGPKTRVVRLPYVPRNQLINLIRGARALAFPSLYEGFGLPIVEAMLCGTAVLTSNCGAMSEIAGEAGLLVDPYDVGSIRDGLKRLVGSASLRDELVAAGYMRAQNFTSEAYQRRLSDAYRLLL